MSHCVDLDLFYLNINMRCDEVRDSFRNFIPCFILATVGLVVSRAG